MVSYGWTIDYINDSVTIPQIIYLLESIKQNPPKTISNFGIGKKNTNNEKNNEEKLMNQINSLGDKVRTESFIDKTSVKSVIRLRDKKIIK